MFDEKIICAGFGGQGVMSMGQLLAYSGMLEDKNVTWMPSYGPEMRGGTAYCCVVISEKPVGSPIITNDATCALVMNYPSLRKFEKSVRPGGLLLVNSSMTEEKSVRSDIEVHYLPANDLAGQCGNQRAANMVMLGAFLAVNRIVLPINVIEAFKKVFGEKGKKHIPLNVLALRKGMEWVSQDIMRKGGANSDYWNVPEAA